MKRREELERKAREIAELIDSGKVELAVSVFEIELGLSYMEGQFNARERR